MKTINFIFKDGKKRVILSVLFEIIIFAQELQYLKM